MRKPDLCLRENKGADHCSYCTAQLISAFVFATRIVQFVFYLNPQFQASSFLPRLYRPVRVGPGRISRRPVFSRRSSCISMYVTYVIPDVVTNVYLPFRNFINMFISFVYPSLCPLRPSCLSEMVGFRSFQAKLLKLENPR